ncbi:helix-turn-helix domain-containing protein [Mediterraneibacter faecis]|uniref:helix-turn-helix domain-containing protein n=1 Tax=Mediterraneibacter faecis TaxID=592978 RepID=UPI003F9C1B55
MAEKRCYTVKDLQDILGVSRPSVYDLLKKNEFRWILVGGKYRISKKSFDAWLDDESEDVE